MSGHTPGPWHLSKAWGFVDGGPHDYHLAEVTGDDAESKANAYLIAAAPDLLGAAEEALALIGALSQHYKDDDKRYRSCISASARLGVAILKAEGR